MDGSPPVPVSPIGILSPFSDPQLRRGHLQAHCPHDEKALRILGPNPEMDYQLFLLHPV